MVAMLAAWLYLMQLVAATPGACLAGQHDGTGVEDITVQKGNSLLQIKHSQVSEAVTHEESQLDEIKHSEVSEAVTHEESLVEQSILHSVIHSAGSSTEGAEGGNKTEDDNYVGSLEAHGIQIAPREQHHDAQAAQQGQRSDHGVNASATPLSLLNSRMDGTVVRGCKFCTCLVTSAVSCGADTVAGGATCGSAYVKDGAQCGFSMIKSAAECGTSVFKECHVTRRRRRIVGEVKCDFSDLAKECKVANSCNVPNTCSIPKSCNMASSFNDCLNEITSTFSGASNDFMKLISNTGCNSVNNCKNVITDGLQGALDAVADAAQSQLSSLLTTVENQVGSGVNSVKDWTLTTYTNAGTLVKSTSSSLQSVGSSVATYFKGQLPTFQPYELGNVCTPSGVGFWYMTGDDCGAFSEMDKIFTDLTNAESHFNAAKSAFATCVTRTGLLGFPTPFLQLSIQTFCLPDAITTGVEYIIGAVIYAANWPNTLQNLITGITTTIKNFASEKLGLLQLGTAFAQRSNVSSVSAGSSQCGSQNNWGLDFMVGMNVAITAGAGMFEFGFGIGIGLGCQGGSLVKPNELFSIGLAYGFSTAVAESSTAVELGLTFSSSFGSYASSRSSIQASLTVESEANLEYVIGAPVAASKSISFSILPSQSTPTGFSFSISPQVAVLTQLGADVSRSSSKAARDTAGADPGLHTLAVMTGALEQLAGPNGLEETLSRTTMDRDLILQKARAIDEHKVSLVQTAQKAQASRVAGAPLSLAVKSELEFTFCITPGSCS